VKIVIVADDLTGAADSAAPFARLGARALVLLEPPYHTTKGPGVVAIDADTRGLSTSEAAAKTREVADWLRRERPAVVFKKIDSTMRGHVAAEIEAMLETLPFKSALVCPAFPAMGRTVEDGRLLVRGRGDLGSVAELAGFASLDRISLPDAPDQATMDRLVRHALTRRGTLFAGSAGMATSLAEALAKHLKARGGPARPPMRGPWLVIAGSQSPVTREQLAVLAHSGVVVEEIAPTTLLDDLPEGIRVAMHVADTLVESRSAALCLGADGFEGGTVGGDVAVAATLAELAHYAMGLAIMRDGSPNGYLLTGGATARAALLQHGVTRLELAGEPLPGIPLAVAVDGWWQGQPIITKAGGFGEPDALVKLIGGA
jgi:uncharacterized protein YgbK (DUF1537 family)